jgi:hypothetical protein
LKEEPHPLKMRFNTSEYASAAVHTVRENLNVLTAGNVWNHIAPKGEYEIKGALLLKQQVVVALHFSSDGSILPRGLHSLSAGSRELCVEIQGRLKNIVEELAVLEGAEFRAPESCWAVPLAHRGRIVAHIKVSADGSKVLEDKRIAAESAQAVSI